MNTEMFTTLFKQLQGGVKEVAEKAAGEYLQEAEADGKTALNGMKENLERWTTELAAGELTMDDFKFLLQEQSDLNKMTALKEAGLAQLKVEAFKGDLISMIVGTASQLIKA